MDTIEERAFKAYPIVKRLLPSGMLLDINSSQRIGYIKACEKYESLPKIHGWVARNKDGEVWWHSHKPSYINDDIGWWYSIGGEHGTLPKDSFPELTYKSNPIEVELLIRKV